MLNKNRLYKLILVLLCFFLISPIISFTIKSAIAEDTIPSDSTNLRDSIIDSIEDKQKKPKESLVYLLKIEGAIGTVTDDRIGQAIKQSIEDNASLLVIYLDTPGGFTKPTWSINKKILNSGVPICIYIAPSGARAGSAGVYMTYASHFAAMAPSTNIGAAHPVAGGGQEVDSIMNEKITNDAVAQIKAAAEKRGRNSEWAEKSVRESVSITDNEALELNVIDFRAENLEDLLSQINGKEIELPKGKVVMYLENAKTKDLGISWIHAILEIITQPDIAFILFSIGSLGIMLELYNPGSIFPGVVGAISLILAFYSFQALPINYAGVALILLAIILFIAEIKIISHGLLTIGGLISFFLGGLMLIDTVDPNLQISMSVLITVVVVVGLAVVGATWLVIKAARNKPFIGIEGMAGKIAEVRKNGFVYVDGALWKAESDDSLNVGEKVEIISLDKLILKVKKINS
ncbi:MAG: nodulation protein NfeD [candidate division Zixibacteria bacterium]|nr:nodulation protein NfeD [candidate division Zixibacteria bacterium]